MLSYVIRRLLATIPVIAVVALLVFSILYLAPGDPAAIMAGDHATAENIAQIRETLGLDKGFIPRFLTWSSGILAGDLGVSIFSRLPVATLIGQSLLPTLSLIIFTIVIAVVVAVPLGVIAAARHNTWIDRVAMVVSVLGFSVPAFAFAYVLAYFIGLKLGWFPVLGFVPPDQGFGRFLSSLFMPSAALSLGYIAVISRIARSSMLDVLKQDYIRTARAKGTGEFAVVFVHALKNAAVPITTVVGIGLASLLGGAVVIETVFAIPGLGQLTMSSILARDYPVIQGILLMVSLGYVFVNLGVDLLYALFDPRIRY